MIPSWPPMGLGLVLGHSWARAGVGEGGGGGGGGGGWGILCLSLRCIIMLPSKWHRYMYTIQTYTFATEQNFISLTLWPD